MPTGGGGVARRYRELDAIVCRELDTMRRVQRVCGEHRRWGQRAVHSPSGGRDPPGRGGLARLRASRALARPPHGCRAECPRNQDRRPARRSGTGEPRLRRNSTPRMLSRLSCQVAGSSRREFTSLVRRARNQSQHTICNSAGERAAEHQSKVQGVPKKCIHTLNAYKCSVYQGIS